MRTVISAKPIEWSDSYDSNGLLESHDRMYGFSVSEVADEPDESRFHAAWGECDGEQFPSAEEAKAWCQGKIDRFIMDHTVVSDTMTRNCMKDAERYRRLSILGCAPAYTKQLSNGTVMRFQVLDDYLDRDLELHPSRGEFQDNASPVSR